eukprot:1842368-Pyramimonas_sp.AAC.1
MRRHIGPGSLMPRRIFRTTTRTESPETSGTFVVKAEKLGSSQSLLNANRPSAQQDRPKPTFR